MSSQQGTLFPEPGRAEQPATEFRFFIIDAADAAGFDETHAALTLGEFTSLADARAGFDESRHWLFDLYADTLHEPGGWPSTEAVSGLTEHRRALAEAAR